MDLSFQSLSHTCPKFTNVLSIWYAINKLATAPHTQSHPTSRIKRIWIFTWCLSQITALGIACFLTLGRRLQLWSIAATISNTLFNIKKETLKVAHVVHLCRVWFSQKKCRFSPKTNGSVFLTDIINILCEVGTDVRCTVQINFSLQTFHRKKKKLLVT